MVRRPAICLALLLVAASPVARAEEEADLAELPADLTELEQAEETTATAAARAAEMAMDEDPDAVRRSERLQEEAATELLVEDAAESAHAEKPAVSDDAAMSEDPEAVRREGGQPPAKTDERFEWEWYGSARVHAVNTFDIATGDRNSSIADGGSRLGARAEWEMARGWYVFGRLELGFNAVDLFSGKASTDGFGDLSPRLANVGIEHDILFLTYGQSWSTYYKIAGMTDRFSIFGGSASGVYNAGTVGDKTGLGRADQVVQARIYVEAFKGLFELKPFNLNLQYQRGQDIPFSEGEKYDYGYGVSAWLETESEFGIGLAYNRSRVPDSAILGPNPAGLDGDAEAFAVSTRNYGEKWYASLMYAQLRNVEVTDLGQYVDSRGVELYAQRQLGERWWIIGGANYLLPDEDDEDAGEFRIKYAILGFRYTFRSFERMLYLEYKFDQGRSVTGATGKDEVTFGVRWDF